MPTLHHWGKLVVLPQCSITLHVTDPLAHAGVIAVPIWTVSHMRGVSQRTIDKGRPVLADVLMILWQFNKELSSLCRIPNSEHVSQHLLTRPDKCEHQSPHKSFQVTSLTGLGPVDDSARTCWLTHYCSRWRSSCPRSAAKSGCIGASDFFRRRVSGVESILTLLDWLAQAVRYLWQQQQINVSKLRKSQGVFLFLCFLFTTWGQIHTACTSIMMSCTLVIRQNALGKEELLMFLKSCLLKKCLVRQMEPRSQQAINVPSCFNCPCCKLPLD